MIVFSKHSFEGHRIKQIVALTEKTEVVYSSTVLISRSLVRLRCKINRLTYLLTYWRPV